MKQYLRSLSNIKGFQSFFYVIRLLRERFQIKIDQLYAMRSIGWFRPPTRKVVIDRVRSGISKRLGSHFVLSGKVCYIGQGKESLWEYHVMKSLLNESKGEYIDGSLWCKNGENEEEIVKIAKKCSAIFLYPFDGMDIVARVASKHTTVFGINWDDHLLWSRSRYWQKVLQYCDCGLSQNQSSARKYAGMGINWLHFAEGGHFESGPLTNKFKPVLVHVGNLSLSKGVMAQSIVKNLGDKLELYGPGTNNGAIAPKHCGNLYRMAAASLALSGYGWSKGMTHLKCRHFEIPCAGGLMIAEYTPGLEKFYDIDREVLTFQTVAEAAAKFLWVLEHPEEAMDIRKRGHQRAQEHTWAKRFTDLLSELDGR